MSDLCHGTDLMGCNGISRGVASWCFATSQSERQKTNVLLRLDQKNYLKKISCTSKTQNFIEIILLQDFFFLCWRYNPLWVLAFLVIFFNSVFSLLSFLHPLIPIVWISSSTSSIHLFLGLPLILLPIGFHSNILLGIHPPSIRITCPSQPILLLFTNLTMSAFPMSYSVHCSFWFCFRIWKFLFTKKENISLFKIFIGKKFICQFVWVWLK